MAQPSNSMRTPLAKARGLGSAKSGGASLVVSKTNGNGYGTFGFISYIFDI